MQQHQLHNWFKRVRFCSELTAELLTPQRQELFLVQLRHCQWRSVENRWRMLNSVTRGARMQHTDSGKIHPKFRGKLRLVVVFIALLCVYCKENWSGSSREEGGRQAGGWWVAWGRMRIRAQWETASAQWGTKREMRWWRAGVSATRTAGETTTTDTRGNRLRAAVEGNSGALQVCEHEWSFNAWKIQDVFVFLRWQRGHSWFSPGLFKNKKNTSSQDQWL